jgi:hypothetical protein
MDYSRIYRAFIADRRRIEPTLEGYTEKHHILPRALGGGDDAENLIRLTAGDHFFAHLLLAKIHGGKMWSPVAFMVGGDRNNWKPVQSRRTYDWVKAGLARSKMGEGAYQFDKETYNVVHRDGRRWAGLQSDMPANLGISRSLANMLVKGRLMSAKGWSISGREHLADRSGANHPSYCPDVFDYRHVDGRQFRGTSYELAMAFGLSIEKTANVRSGRQRVHNGWYRDDAPPHGVGRGAKLPGTYTGSRVRLVHDDGRVFEGTRREAVEKLGIKSVGNVSMVVSGRRSHVHGWRLAA